MKRTDEMRSKNLAKNAVENEGVFAFAILNEIGDLLIEIATGVVQRPCYVPIVTPFVIPSTNKTRKRKPISNFSIRLSNKLHGRSTEREQVKDL